MFSPSPTPTLSLTLTALNEGRLEDAAVAMSDEPWAAGFVEECVNVLAWDAGSSNDPDYDPYWIEYQIDKECEHLSHTLRDVAFSHEIAQMFVSLGGVA
jgi:hypothetical protein